MNHKDMTSNRNMSIGVSKTLFIPILIMLSVLVSASLQSKELKISTTELPPVGYKNESGISMGFLYEIANKIAENAKIEYINKLKPYPRVIRDLDVGTADIAILYPNDKLKDKVVYVAPILTDSNVIVVKAPFTIRSLDELYGRKVANVRNAHYSDDYDSSKKIIKVEVHDNEQGLRMLLRGRVDALIGAAGSISFALKSMDLEWSVLGKPYVINTKTTWMQMSKRRYDKEVAAKLKISASELTQQGVIRDIIVKYGVDTPFPRHDAEGRLIAK